MSNAPRPSFRPHVPTPRAGGFGGRGVGHRPRRRPAVPILLGLGLCIGLLGCPDAPKRDAPPAHAGPVVLITLDALRADVLETFGGPPGLTPHLDALAQEADWTGRAVSVSSWTVPSMATLFTGLQPWRHGVFDGSRALLREELRTLPEALGEVGYRTAGFRTNHWLQRSFGYSQGFDRFGYLGSPAKAVEHLASLDGGRDFVWAHVLPPHAPYVRRQKFLDRLPGDAEDLPEKLRPLDLEPYYDPGVALSDDEKRRAWRMYLLHAAWADEILGRLLAGLRRSGQWEQTLLIVTSDHGEEFGENDQILHGGNLHRVLLEVPLLVKLPAGSSRTLAAPGPISTARIFSTLLEATGAEPTPGAAPSLFAATPHPPLAELYSGDGVNRFALIDGTEQLVWTSRFAPSEEEYYRARLESLGQPVTPPLAEAPDAVFARLESRFNEVPPLRGLDSTVDLALWRWNDDGSVSRVEDRERAESLARRLRALWRERNGDDRPAGLPGSGPELSEEDLAGLKALGYTTGGAGRTGGGSDAGDPQDEPDGRQEPDGR